MRDISTLTPFEGAGLWNAIMPPPTYKPFIGSAHKFKATEKAPDRFIFMSGVERLCVQFDGKIWADSDLQKIDLDPAQIQDYLTSINILNTFQP